MTEAEFKIGEIVTFHGYAKELIKAKVVDIYHTPHKPDKEWEYRLTGISQNLLSITSGKFIVESKLYDGKDWDGKQIG